MTEEKSSPRERLLETAGKLFQRHGFQAVGIDRILAESGVAKMTLYRYFKSKDELIAAYLEQFDVWFQGWAEASMQDAPTPEEKLVALADAVGRLASNPACLGCIFQGAALAFPEPEHPGHRVALRHKLAVRERLADLARQAKLHDPDGLAAELSLLIDGAWISARMFRQGENPATQVGRAARALIDAHRPARSRKPSRRR